MQSERKIEQSRFLKSKAIGRIIMLRLLVVEDSATLGERHERPTRFRGKVMLPGVTLCLLL